jgi:hypothetical protein
MNRWGVRFLVLAVLCTILFLPVAVSAQGFMGAATPMEYPEGLVHTVVKGDTLWDLSEKYLGSPWLWPDLWERNRFISNPHYIYPGISVVVYPPPPREYGWEFKEHAPAPEGETVAMTKAAAEGQVAPPTAEAVEEPPAVLQISPEEFVRAGEFTPARPKGIGSIAGGQEDKDAFSETDNVYLSLDKEIPEGQILGVYRVRGPVKSHTARPVSGYVRFLVGIVQVTGKNNGQPTAVVRKSFSDLTRQDLIREEIPSYSPVYPKEGESGVEAFVITGREPKVALSTNDFVYLDQGTDAGMAVGDVYRIYDTRGGTTWYGRDEIEAVHIPVGKAVIVRVLPGSATAYVTYSTQDISAGAIAQPASAEAR